jgi:hypothetical protein
MEAKRQIFYIILENFCKQQKIKMKKRSLNTAKSELQTTHMKKNNAASLI